MQHKPEEMFWMGKCLTEMSRDELLAVVVAQQRRLEHLLESSAAMVGALRCAAHARP
jgi:hypothetical protein